MKKIVVFVFVFAISTGLMAQKSQLGFKAGANVARWKMNVDNEEYKNRLGFHLGLVHQTNLSKATALQTGIAFSTKGTKNEHAGHNDIYVINAIDIPVNFIYKAPTQFGNYFIGGGPNFGFNISGKLKEEDASEKIEIGSNPGQIKGFDFGANLTTGIQTKKGLLLSLNYNLGLSNLSNANGITTRSNVLGISVGYFLKSSK